MMRRLAAALLLVAGGLAVAPAAMAGPAGTCDPATRGMAYNDGTYAVDNGAVTVNYRYGWDGVSVMPDCVGPMLLVSGTNASQVVYYAHFQGRKGTWLRVQINPGQTVTLDKQGQLRQAGFNDNTDLEGLRITTDPNHPAS